MRTDRDAIWMMSGLDQLGMQRTVAAMAQSNKVPSGQTASATSK